jgi:putative transposase
VVGGEPRQLRAGVLATAVGIKPDPAYGNTDYAEVGVKPRICGDGLFSWGVLADFSA